MFIAFLFTFEVEVAGGETVVAFVLFFVLAVHLLFVQERVEGNVFGVLHVLAVNTVAAFTVGAMSALPFHFCFFVILVRQYTIKTLASRSMITLQLDLLLLFTLLNLHLLLLHFLDH